MEYNDEKLLSIDEYEIMAKAYSAHLKDKGFIFVQVDGRENEQLICDTYELFCRIKSSLLFLGNFLNTGKLYTLNERQIKTFQIMYPSCEQNISYKIRGDKTKCFLNLQSLESKLLSNLLSLSEQSPFSNQILRIIEQRLYLTSEIYKIEGLIF